MPSKRPEESDFTANSKRILDSTNVTIRMSKYALEERLEDIKQTIFFLKDEYRKTLKALTTCK